MAVITNKGDEYAIYNGIKFPNINCSWGSADWAGSKCKYAVIVKNPNNDYYELLTSTSALVRYNDMLRGTGGSNYQAAVIPYKLIDNTWTKATGGAGRYEYTCEVLWSSYDIINSVDSSVYMKGTKAIPLDWMQVIEWDGDTTDLESVDNSFYKISDTPLSKEELTNCIYCISNESEIVEFSSEGMSIDNEGDG